MKSILLHVDGDDCMEARLQVALDIARAHSAHITCLQAVNYEVFAPGDFYGSALAAAMPKIKQAAEKLRAKIEADLAKEDVTWEWRLLHGMAETKLLEQSALHDLVIVGPHDIGVPGQGPSILVGNLVLHASVPVLVVPAEWRQFDPKAPVLVGWNGSSEACLALRAALPLLGMAEQVYLASIAENYDRERFDFPPVDGAEYLSRHGINAELLEIPRGETKVADMLFSAAQLKECGLVVMGAYGHSRLSELLFGGVTRSALTDPQMPILLAH